MAGRRGLFVRKDATAGTGPQDARLAIAGLVTGAGDLAATPGVISGCVVSGMAAWTYSVSAGHYVTTRGGSDGVVVGAVDGATTTDAVSAAPASGSRWDLIWVRQRDVDAGDADSQPVVNVTSGSSGGSPTKPYGSVPVGALVLAEAQVSAGATQTAHASVVITPVAVRVAARGGVVPVASASARAALATAASPSVTNPLLVWQQDTKVLHLYDGATPRALTGELVGSVAAVAEPGFTTGTKTAVASTTLAHPFTGPVIVEAEIVGDLVVGANSTVRVDLTAGGLTRTGRSSNAAPANLSLTPVATARTRVESGAITVSLTVTIVEGVAGASWAAGQMAVQWSIRPAAVA